MSVHVAAVCEYAIEEAAASHISLVILPRCLWHFVTSSSYQQCLFEQVYAPPHSTPLMRRLLQQWQSGEADRQRVFKDCSTHTLPCSSTTLPLLLKLLDWQARAGLLCATCSIPYNDLCVSQDSMGEQWSASVEGGSYVSLNADLQNWDELFKHIGLLTRKSCWLKAESAPGYWYGKQFCASVCVPRAKLAVTTSSLCSLSLRLPLV